MIIPLDELDKYFPKSGTGKECNIYFKKCFDEETGEMGMWARCEGYGAVAIGSFFINEPEMQSLSTKFDLRLIKSLIDFDALVFYVGNTNNGEWVKLDKAAQ
jgi:hypothetical protein